MYLRMKENKEINQVNKQKLIIIHTSKVLLPEGNQAVHESFLNTSEPENVKETSTTSKRLSRKL